MRHALRWMVMAGVWSALAGTAWAAEAPVPPAESSSTILDAIAFYAMAAVALFSGLAILVSRNLVRNVVFLLAALGAIAGLYFLLAANLLGAIQLIVYAGGTLVLITFGVMLTSRPGYDRQLVREWERIAGGAVCVTLFIGLCVVLLRTEWATVAASAEPTTVAAVGRALLTDYLVPFEVASVLLLVMLIGAAYLVRRDGESGAEDDVDRC